MANKQGITITEKGRRTTGIQQFFDELPDYIIPVQKGEPPYMPYTNGHGYLGVLLLDTDKDRVQCHICGRWYKALGKHITVHGILSNEYKDTVGLYRKEPLMSLRTIYKFRDTNNKIKSKKNLEKGWNMISGARKGREVPNGSQTVQWKNKYGTCDAQLQYRLEEAIKKYGRVPKTEEEPRLANTLERRFGSWTKALDFYGHQPYRQPGVFKVQSFKQMSVEEIVAADKKRIEEEVKIAPHCKICGKIIERKRWENGRLENRIKWLNKKTDSPQCLEKYINSKITFRGCLIEGCENHHQAKGYCIKHYLEICKPNRNRKNIHAI